MNTTIVPEVQFFLSSIVFGALLCACYDQLRVFRALVRHSVSATDAEDILFFLTAGLVFFGLLYIRNEGSMRWFAFLGCALGAICYLKTLGPLLRLAEITIFRFLFFPVAALYRQLAAFGRKKRLQKQEKRTKIKAQKAEKRKEKQKVSGDKKHEPKKAKKKKRT